MKLISITPCPGGHLILRWYEVDHSAASLNPNTDGSAFIRHSLSAFSIAKKFSDGIAPRNFQLLTAGALTPTSVATAAVPPRALTMSSTELSMRDTNSLIVNLSSIHSFSIANSKKSIPNRRMLDSKAVVGDRLRVWLLAKFMRAAELCEIIDCDTNEWSQFVTGKRMVTLEIADQLCREFQLTLDWIYRDDPRGIDIELRKKIREIREMEANGVSVPMPPIRRVRNSAKPVATNRRKAARS